uniref:Uncharacterized protein n=1 Tax=Phenylobacterium glaciei TaxID=2803784 RepID=A0A974P6X6_9CAUL|nr:hypothetical protein JKL49_12975 [Phenylobacterium glaciei]
MGLHPLLLRADHQEVEQHDQADKRQELHQHFLRAAAGGGAGGLSEGGVANMVSPKFVIGPAKSRPF